MLARLAHQRSLDGGFGLGQQHLSFFSGDQRPDHDRVTAGGGQRAPHRQLRQLGQPVHGHVLCGHGDPLRGLSQALGRQVQVQRFQVGQGRQLAHECIGFARRAWPDHGFFQLIHLALSKQLRVLVVVVVDRRRVRQAGLFSKLILERPSQHLALRQRQRLDHLRLLVEASFGSGLGRQFLLDQHVEGAVGRLLAPLRRDPRLGSQQGLNLVNGNLALVDLCRDLRIHRTSRAAAAVAARQRQHRHQTRAQHHPPLAPSHHVLSPRCHDSLASCHMVDPVARCHVAKSQRKTGPKARFIDHQTRIKLVACGDAASGPHQPGPPASWRRRKLQEREKPQRWSRSDRRKKPCPTNLHPGSRDH